MYTRWSLHYVYKVQKMAVEMEKNMATEECGNVVYFDFIIIYNLIFFFLNKLIFNVFLYIKSIGQNS